MMRGVQQPPSFVFCLLSFVLNFKLKTLSTMGPDPIANRRFADIPISNCSITFSPHIIPHFCVLVSAATLRPPDMLQQRNHDLRILLVSVIMLLRQYSNLLFYNQAFYVHYPQNNPITNAYILHPHVAKMFRNIRRLGDIGNVANVKMLPIPIINEQLSCHAYP